MNQIPFLDRTDIDARLPWDTLIETLADAFMQPVEAPVRMHGDLGSPSAAPEQRDLLVMPAWVPGGEIGVKLVTLFEHNDRRDHPRIQGLYMLFHAEHGAPVAMLDAAALTTRRTAAASALAARHLAQPDARRLLICGSGNLARALPQAHASVRALAHIDVWARRGDAARDTAADLRKALPGIEIQVAQDLEAAAREADIVSTAIPSTDAFLRGAWLKAGAHLDLVGSYRPDMHEIDAEGLLRATCFVDTRPGVLAEAGEFIDAIAAGLITEDDIAADLPALVSAQHPGRSSASEITLFKSVGTALEDLAAARLAVSRARA